MAHGLHLDLRIRLVCGDEIAMGPGKADLLEAIKAHGSISAAARAMGMSYRRAWLLVDAMNRCWREPVIVTLPGGGRDSGAQVTAFGGIVVGRYRALCAGAGAGIAGEDLAGLADAIRPQPRKSQKP